MSDISRLEVIIESTGAQAVVSDLTQVQNAQNGLQKATGGAADALKDMGRGATESLEPVGGLSDVLGDFGGTAAVVAATVMAVASAFGEVLEMAEEGAGMQRVLESTGTIARTMGTDAEAILSTLRETSLGMVSDLELAQSASRAMMLGVSADADQLGQLMEVAAARGRIMGIDTTQSFDDIVRGLGRLSPHILDNLGVVIDAKSTYDAYAESIGKSANELTKAEKTQALLNKVLEESQPLLAQTGGLVVDNAGKWEQMHAAKANYFNSLKMDLAEGMSWWAEYWAGVFNEKMDVKGAREIFYEARQLGLIPAELQAAFDIATRGGQGDYQFMLDHLDTIDQLVPKIDTLKTATADWAAANYEGAEGVAAATAALETQKLILEETAEEIKQMAKIQEELASVTSLTTNFSGMIGFAKSYDTILEQIAEQEEIMAKNPVWSKKYKEAEEALNGLKGSMKDLANQVVLDMFMATIAVGGVTEAEAAAYFDLAVDMGQISREAADAAMEAYGGAIEYINGLKIDPKTGQIIFEIDTTEVDRWQPPTKYGTVSFSPPTYGPQHNAPGNALGGPVYPGETYLVGERGPEPFIPNVPGRIFSTSDYALMLNGATNSTLEIDYKRLGKAVSESIIEAAESGRLGGNTYINANGNKYANASTDFEILRAYGGNF